MATLYKRASIAQKRLLKIIEGAVLNTYDAHGKPRDPKEARGIAKRATGTLSAWPKVLAALTKPSATSGVECSGCPTCGRSYSLEADCAGRHTVRRRSGGVSSKLTRRHPLLLLWGRVAMQMREIKHTGTSEQIEARVELLRMIDQLHKELSGDACLSIRNTGPKH